MGRLSPLAGHTLDLLHMLALMLRLDRRDLAHRQNAALVVDARALPVASLQSAQEGGGWLADHAELPRQLTGGNVAIGR